MQSSAPLRPLAIPAEVLRLRWAVVAVQAPMLGWAVFSQGSALLPFAAVALVLSLAGQLLCQRFRAGDLPVALLLAVDIGILTLLLVANGGATSGFTSLFLLYPALAATVLSPRLAWAACALVLFCYGGMLLELPAPAVGPHAHHAPPGAASGVVQGHDMRGHAISMFLAVGIASPVLVLALLRARSTLALADARLLAARQAEEQGRRLASLATLAAGASHELATPLATIAVAAGELGRRASSDSPEGRDAALIRQAVERCRRVLQELSADVGAGSGEQQRCVPLGDVLELILEGHGDEVEVEMDESLEERRWTLPPRLLAQAVRRLIGNALHASAPGLPVLLRVRTGSYGLTIEVQDQGSGMSADVLARATEPFFTTRPDGTGLGLWFAQSVAEHLGGTLSLRSEPGRGTTASLHLPDGESE